MTSESAQQWWLPYCRQTDGRIWTGCRFLTTTWQRRHSQPQSLFWFTCHSRFTYVYIKDNVMFVHKKCAPPAPNVIHYIAEKINSFLGIRGKISLIDSDLSNFLRLWHAGLEIYNQYNRNDFWQITSNICDILWHWSCKNREWTCLKVQKKNLNLTGVI